VEGETEKKKMFVPFALTIRSLREIKKCTYTQKRIDVGTKESPQKE